ncbi:MAG: RNA methyltransferase [Patescibacteria group bacterium]
MLTPAQEKLLQQLTTKRGRREAEMFVIEGEKFVRDAGGLVEFTFTPADTTRFAEYVSTETPQAFAAVARIPKVTMKRFAESATIVVLDGVQDPGNVGTILRAALGFGASVLLVESAEVTNPKVVRASASAILRTPWMTVAREDAGAIIASFHRPVYRLELRDGAVLPDEIRIEPCVVVAGSEGKGITLPVAGTSVAIPHNPALESLNVGVATSIILYERSKQITV